jgi:hypothetical protein
MRYCFELQGAAKRQIKLFYFWKYKTGGKLTGGGDGGPRGGWAGGEKAKKKNGGRIYFFRKKKRLWCFRALLAENPRNAPVRD